MIKIDELSFEELEKAMTELGEPKFKAKQIFDWIHEKTVDSFDKMSNVSKKTKEELAIKYEFTKSLYKIK